MYKIYITSHAQTDLDEILAYIGKTLDNPTAASHFADKLEQVFDQMAEHPYSFEQSQDASLRCRGYRKVVIESYILLYLVDDHSQTIQIARLFYGRRDYAKYI